MAAFALLMILLCMLTLTTGQDPCITAVILLDDGGRSPVCSLSYNQCDRYLREDWYRLQLDTGDDLTMPTFPVPVNSCGTRYPIWLNGSHPTEVEGIVERTGCVSTNLNNCRLTYNIKIKNCTKYMVYYLKRAQGCNQRYCFESKESAGVCSPLTITPTTSTIRKTTTTTTKTSTTTTITTISSTIRKANQQTTQRARPTGPTDGADDKARTSTGPTVGSNTNSISTKAGVGVGVGVGAFLVLSVVVVIVVKNRNVQTKNNNIAVVSDVSVSNMGPTVPPPSNVNDNTIYQQLDQEARRQENNPYEELRQNKQDVYVSNISATVPPPSNDHGNTIYQQLDQDARRQEINPYEELRHNKQN